MSYYNEEGREVHVRNPDPATIAALNLAACSASSSNSAESILIARDDEWSYHCGCGIEMNHGDYDAAVVELKSQLGGGLSICPDRAYYSIHGDVVAFACSINSRYCMTKSDDDYGNMLGEITNRCGWYVPGTYFVDYSYYEPHLGTFTARVDFGYMRSWENGATSAVRQKPRLCSIASP
ncbi:hypothetical protein GQ53DRAFT_821788 [Thozetella sp. PMI_491]|nr:hypothetical protein GQ53DRAFT_821788 [Thozetella sp. PMI_491]